MARIGAAAIAPRGKAQKYKIVENCVRINERRVGLPLVSAAETAM